MPPRQRAAAPSRRTRKPAAPVAPHLAQPELRTVTARTYPAWHRAFEAGFQEEHHPEMLDFDRPLMEFDRAFGFAVGDRWVSTCGAFSRELTVPGGAAVPTAAVTVVTVHAPFRRRGLLTAMMRHQLEDVARRGEPLAALWASESSIYGRFGYGPAAARAMLQGTNRRLTFLPGVPVEGSVDEVDRERFLTVAPALHEAGRADRPGGLDRPAKWWDQTLVDFPFFRHGSSELHFLLHHDAAGDVDGYALYRFKEDFGPTEPTGEVIVREIRADSPAAHAGLWRYLLDLDLARTFSVRNAPVDEPLRHLVTDARAVETRITDNLYVRVVDVRGALQARRYRTEVDAVIEVTDPLLPQNTGRWRLRGGPGAARVTRSREEPDVSLGVLELGTVYLGGPSLVDLARAGRVTEHRPGALEQLSTAFGWHRAPWCPDNF